MPLVLAVIAAAVVGLMVGVELAVALVVNRILLGLGPGPCLEGRAHGARMLGRVMPFWYCGSVGVTIALTVATWGSTEAVITLVAAALLALSVVLSVTLLVPINNRSMSWTAAEHPTDWREQLASWDRYHYGRLAIIVAAYVLILVAIV